MTSPDNTAHNADLINEIFAERVHGLGVRYTPTTTFFRYNKVSYLDACINDYMYIHKLQENEIKH